MKRYSGVKLAAVFLLGSFAPIAQLRAQAQADLFAAAPFQAPLPVDFSGTLDTLLTSIAQRLKVPLEAVPELKPQFLFVRLKRATAAQALDQVARAVKGEWKQQKKKYLLKVSKDLEAKVRDEEAQRVKAANVKMIEGWGKEAESRSPDQEAADALASIQRLSDIYQSGEAPVDALGTLLTGSESPGDRLLKGLVKGILKDDRLRFDPWEAMVWSFPRNGVHGAFPTSASASIARFNDVEAAIARVYASQPPPANPVARSIFDKTVTSARDRAGLGRAILRYGNVHMSFGRWVLMAYDANGIAKGIFTVDAPYELTGSETGFISKVRQVVFDVPKSEQELYGLLPPELEIGPREYAAPTSAQTKLARDLLAGRQDAESILVSPLLSELASRLDIDVVADVPEFLLSCAVGSYAKGKIALAAFLAKAFSQGYRVEGNSAGVILTNARPIQRRRPLEEASLKRYLAGALSSGAESVRGFGKFALEQAGAEVTGPEMNFWRILLEQAGVGCLPVGGPVVPTTVDWRFIGSISNSSWAELLAGKEIALRLLPKQTNDLGMAIAMRRGSMREGDQFGFFECLPAAYNLAPLDSLTVSIDYQSQEVIKNEQRGGDDLDAFPQMPSTPSECAERLRYWSLDRDRVLSPLEFLHGKFISGRRSQYNIRLRPRPGLYIPIDQAEPVQWQPGAKPYNQLPESFRKKLDEELAKP